MYEKIFNRFKRLGVYDTLENLNLELNDERCNLNIFKNTLENLKMIFDDYDDECYSYNVVDVQKCSSILQKSLETKIENSRKKIVSIEEKIVEAKEDVEMMNFLKKNIERS